MSNRKGIMLCAPYEQRRLLKWLAEDGYVIFQPKYDGDRLRALLTDSQPLLLSSEEKDRNFALPLISEQIKSVQRVLAKHGLFELDGEAYNHELSHEEIHGVCSRTTNLHPDHRQIEYHIFDHVIGGVPQCQRLMELNHREVREAFEHCPNLVLVPSINLTTENEVMLYYKAALIRGYEGMVIRKATGIYKQMSRAYMQKFKPKRHDVYTIVAVIQELTIHKEPKPMVGSFLCRDDEGTEFAVSAGMTDKEKMEYWEMRNDLIGLKIKVYYQATTKNGKPKFATDLEVLI